MKRRPLGITAFYRTEEKQAASRARQAALKNLKKNYKKILAALKRAEAFTVEKAMRRCARLTPASRSYQPAGNASVHLPDDLSS